MSDNEQQAMAAQQEQQAPGQGPPIPAPRQLEGIDATIAVHAQTAAAHAMAIGQAIRGGADEAVVATHLDHLTNAVESINALHGGDMTHEDFPESQAVTQVAGKQADDIHAAADELHYAIHSGASPEVIADHAHHMAYLAESLGDHVSVLTAPKPGKVTFDVGAALEEDAGKASTWPWVALGIVTAVVCAAVAWYQFGEPIQWPIH